MAGPGGGGRSGGGFGGGRPVGGFGGGPHMGGGYHRAPMGGGWHHTPRRYRSGGGCCGGFMGMFVIGLFILFMIIYFMLPESGTVISSNGYDEERFQDYANSQYKSEFGSSSAYEDNLLLTVLVEDEEYYNFYYIAWVGDHVAADVNYLMGNNDTELGQTLESSISATSYKYSLDADLARAIDSMTKQVAALGLEDSFTCTENHAQVKSHLTNHSSIDMTEETVNEALEAFTETTGIPIVIVVEDMDDVFGRFASSSAVPSSTGMSTTSIVTIAAVVIAVIAIVVTIRRQKTNSTEFGTTQKDSRYHDFDDQY